MRARLPKRDQDIAQEGGAGVGECGSAAAEDAGVQVLLQRLQRQHDSHATLGGQHEADVGLGAAQEKGRANSFGGSKVEAPSHERLEGGCDWE